MSGSSCVAFFAWLLREIRECVDPAPPAKDAGADCAPLARSWECRGRSVGLAVCCIARSGPLPSCSSTFLGRGTSRSGPEASDSGVTSRVPATMLAVGDGALDGKGTCGDPLSPPAPPSGVKPLDGVEGGKGEVVSGVGNVESNGLRCCDHAVGRSGGSRLCGREMECTRGRVRWVRP